jgi:hypothetical protein
MVKFDPPFDASAVLIRSLLDQGRREEARQMIIEEASNSSEFVQLIVDEFVKIKTRGKGAPQKKLPPHYIEIGTDFEGLTGEGMTYDAAINTLAKKYSAGRHRIVKTVAFFMKGRV